MRRRGQRGTRMGAWLTAGVLLVAGMVGMGLLPQAAGLSDWPDPAQMTFDPVDVTPIEPERVVLSNGLVVYLMENRELPLIEGEAYIRAGAVLDPPDQVGLAGMVSHVMRSGGAGGRSADEIDEQLEYLAASVEVSASDELAAAQFSSLADNVDEVLAVFADVLTAPDFEPDRIELARERVFEAIRRRNDQPVEIALREFIKRMAEGHPVGRFSTFETVGAIDREDLVAFHERYFRPNATILAMTGDFDTEDMIAKLEDTLGAWEPVEVAYPELPAFNPNPEPMIYHAPKAIGQSIILAGHPSVTFDSPEYAALDVVNRILGVAGGNRLFTEIRTRRGLAYAVGSQVTQGFAYPGFFFAYSISRADATGEVIELLRREIGRMQAEPPSLEELQQSRDAIANRAVFRYTSAAEVTGRAALVEFLDVRPDYYERYIEQVQALTPEELQRVAQEQLRPDEMIIMVVGHEPLFDRSLEEFGPVETIHLDE